MTIYTAIFGNYDDLKEPFVITPGWRYVCFTDQDITSDIWEVKKVPIMSCGPAKTARYYKIMFYKHIESEFSIWIDATFIINCDLNKWWERFKSPFTVVKHPFDNCVYREAAACMRMQKANPKLLHNQVQCYRRLGVPKNIGLIASGVLMRKNTESVNGMCRIWWEQVERHSPRDQVAFGYVHHKFPGIHHVIEWDYTKENEFIHIPHLHKKWRHGRMDEILSKYVQSKGK